MAFNFPDPNVTTEFTGDNGITYSWDANDGKWQIKRYAADFDDRYVNKEGLSLIHISEPTRPY